MPRTAAPVRKEGDALVFNSAGFLFAFLPVTWLLYRLLPGERSRTWFLIAASLVFYACGGLAQAPVLIGCAIWSFLFGRLLARRDGARKLWLILAVTGDLAVLAAYKYTDFLLGAAGLAGPGWSAAAPLGISFFTFHAVSYAVDVYREPERAADRFGPFFLYIAFFPRLLAGPILRWKDASLTPEPPADPSPALRRFVRGLAKKLLLAESAAAAANAVFALSPGEMGGRLAWLGAFAYCLQIYYDFSGYSDMAIALGGLFGFRFPENFDHPYVSLTVREFWRRWHMSLNRWFTDYLYIPLGGSRRGIAVTVRNTLIVFLATGLWHGAGWTFVLWGLWHGVLVSAERLLADPLERLGKKAPGALRIYTLLAVMLGFVMFRAPSAAYALAMLGRMFSFAGETAAGALAFRRILSGARAAALIAGTIFALPAGPWLRQKLSALPSGEVILDAAALAGLALCVTAMSGGGFTPFIYQQF